MPFRPGLLGLFFFCRLMEGFLIQGWGLILPGYGGISTLSRGANFVARWFNEPQPVSDQWMNVEFPHRERRYRPGRSRFSSTSYWSCLYTEYVLIRVGTLSSPGAVGPRHWSKRSLSLRTGSMSLIPSSIGWGLGFHTVRSGIDPRDHCLLTSPGSWSCILIEGFMTQG